MSPATAVAPRAGSIRIDVTMPVTRIGVGPFSFDALEQVIGCPLVELLEPLMVGPVGRRPSEAGPAVEVYPLALPEGEGASIPLGSWGEVGFRNEGGLLMLTVPWGMAGWLRRKLGDALVRGPEAGISADGAARVAIAWVRLRPGMRASVPMGVLGECGVEAG